MTTWPQLRAHTPSRIGLGRAGNAIATAQQLELVAAHAEARDAVHVPLDVAALAGEIDALGIGAARWVTSRAADRDEYLRRPDLGRLPADGALESLAARAAPSPSNVESSPDIAIVLADGLSPTAIARHGAGLLAALVERLAGRLRIAPPVIATGARVALGDHVGERLGATIVLVLIGERPGLSVADSVGVYLTHSPLPGRNDAERNCVSNIHQPSGLDYASAARIVDGLIVGALRLGRSGVALKDASRVLDGTATDALAPGPAPQP